MGLYIYIHYIFNELGCVLRRILSILVGFIYTVFPDRDQYIALLVTNYSKINRINISILDARLPHLPERRLLYVA